MHVTAEFHDDHCINYNAYLLGVFADYYTGEVYDRNAKEYGAFVFTSGHEDNQDSLEEQFAAGGVFFRLR